MSPTAPIKETKAEECGARPGVSGAPVLTPPRPAAQASHLPRPASRCADTAAAAPGLLHPREHSPTEARGFPPANQSTRAEDPFRDWVEHGPMGTSNTPGFPRLTLFVIQWETNFGECPALVRVPLTNRKRRLGGGAAGCGAEPFSGLDGCLAGSVLDWFSSAWPCGCLGAALACAGILASAGCYVPVFRAAALGARKTGTGRSPPRRRPRSPRFTPKRETKGFPAPSQENGDLKMTKYLRLWELQTN